MTSLLMAVWRRQPTEEVIDYSDRDSQYTNYEWQDLLKANSLISIMSQRGKSHDNMVVESFSSYSYRRESSAVYPDRQTARADTFNHIEMIYDRQRKHGYNDMLAPVEYERRLFMNLRRV